MGLAAAFAVVPLAVRLQQVFGQPSFSLLRCIFAFCFELLCFILSRMADSHAPSCRDCLLL
jgi:hypothetical protein